MHSQSSPQVNSSAQAPQSALHSRRNIIVIVLLFVFAAALYAACAFALPTQQKAYAVVHASDGSEKKLALDSNQTLTITTDEGTNVIVVEDGTVRVDQADCPGHDCVQQGAIKERNQQIVCLPHKLWIEIASSEDESAFDSVAR